MQPLNYKVHQETCELSYKLQGKGVPILLIHGAACDSSYFQKAADLLSAAFCVITYDRRGYASSKASQNADFSIEEQAKDAVRILEHAGIASAACVGSSAGGLIALEIARQFPEKVSCLFLHEPPIGISPAHTRQILQWFNQLWQDASQRKIPKACLDFIQPIGGADPLAEPMSMERQRQSLRNLETFLYGELDALISHFQQPQPTLPIKIPCLLTAGTDDAEALLSQAAPRAAEQLQCGFCRLPGYHNLALDRPQVFVEAVTKFLLPALASPTVERTL